MSIEIKPKFIFLILLGHLRTLCPGCRHAPQSRKRLAGGLSLMEEVVVLKMESGKWLVEEKLPSMVKYRCLYFLQHSLVHGHPFRHIDEVKLSLFHSLHDLCSIVSLINAHLSIHYHTTLACILLLFRTILRMLDGSTILLTNMTQVFHRLHHHYAAARAE